MAKLDEDIIRQLGKIKVYFLKYYPSRIRNVGEQQIADRQTIYDFKDGKAYEEVAQMAVARLKEQFGEKTTDIVFSCVPASSAEKNELRYKKFSERVCQLSGAINGYPHVKVSGERLSVHDRKGEKTICKVQTIEYDRNFFKGKSVLLFDDVITRGVSYATVANELESYGATVLGGFFLGKTFYKIR